MQNDASAEDIETEYECDGSDNEEENSKDGEPRFHFILPLFILFSNHQSHLFSYLKKDIPHAVDDYKVQVDNAAIINRLINCHNPAPSSKSLVSQP